MTYGHWRIPFVVLSVGLSVLRASAGDCERRISASAPSARTVILAGGDAWTLFRQFLSEIEQRDLDVSLWRTEVQISRGGQTETFVVGWAKALSGASAETLWERNLSGKRAEINPQLLAEARAAKWDVVCVGKVPSEKVPEPHKPPPPPPVPPPTSEALIFFKSGMQYAARGEYANALKEFKAAEKIAPGFNGLAMNLGVTYLQMKDYVHAAEYLGRAVIQNPKDYATHYNLACLQARLGQQDDAIASLLAAKANGMQMTAATKRDPDLSSLRGRTDFNSLFN
jgi:tetratricopeptide (TPR) repeat protein